jgi:hypothetical protein
VGEAASRKFGILPEEPEELLCPLKATMKRLNNSLSHPNFKNKRQIRDKSNFFI